jgi:hypothetical protein
MISIHVCHVYLAAHSGERESMRRRRPGGGRTAPLSSATHEVAGSDEISLERNDQRIGSGFHARTFQPIDRCGDMRNAAVQVTIEVASFAVGHLHLTREGALAATQANPPVSLAAFLPGHRVHEVATAGRAVDESPIRARRSRQAPQLAQSA